MAEDDAAAFHARQLGAGGNRLLAIANPTDLRFLAACGKRERFARGNMVVRAGQPMAAAYFVEQGIASVVKPEAGEPRTEVCLVGPEGFVGSAIVQADGRAPYEVFVQSDQLIAWRVEAGDLRHLFQTSAEFRSLVHKAIYVHMIQIAENLVSAVWQRTTVRLARWLLMYHDRICSPQLEITHEFMAIMIGAQRSKVTDSIHDLEGAGAIAASRGRIVIKDAGILQRFADGTYGFAEQESERLLRAGRLC